MGKSYYILFVVVLFLIPSSASSQEEVLTTESVLNMLSLGLSEEIIISKIAASEGHFDTSIGILQSMKNAGVSNNIIVAMIKKEKENKDQEKKEAEEERKVGLFYLKHKELIRIYPTTFSGTRTNTLGTVFSYGLASSKIRSTIVGSFSNNKVISRTPEFYFFFDKKNNENSNTDWWFSTASSPNQFVLAKLHIGKNKRELGTGKVNLYSGSSIGVDEEDIIAINITPVNKYEFKVTPAEPLKSGEYCFFYQGMIPMGGFNQAVFDFSVPANVAAFSSKYIKDDIVWVRFGKNKIKRMVITSLHAEDDDIFYKGYELSERNEFDENSTLVGKEREWRAKDCSFNKEELMK